METRRLGRTGLEGSVLSIGGLYTSSLAGGESETRRIMQRASELGVNAIDTARAYAMVPHWPCEEPMILPFGKNYVGSGIANMGPLFRLAN